MRHNEEEAQVRESVMEAEIKQLQEDLQKAEKIAEKPSRTVNNDLMDDEEDTENVAKLGSDGDEGGKEEEEVEPKSTKSARLEDYLHKKHKPKPRGKKAAEPRPLEWLIDHIDAIWRSKCESDKIDDCVGHRHQPLPVFVYEYMLQLHGTKPAADKQTFAFIDAVEHHKKTCAQVALFAKFLDNVYSLDVCNFYVFLHDQIANSVYGVNYPQTIEEDGSRTSWVDTNRTLMVSRTVLREVADMTTIMKFNAKVEKQSIRCEDSDVQTSQLARKSDGERKIEQVTYEEMCLGVFTKARVVRLKTIRKALFKGKKVISQPGFMENFEAMDIAVPKRHISRLFTEASKYSPATGINFPAFSKVAEETGLFEDNFCLLVEEQDRTEEENLKRLIQDAIRDAWNSEMDQAITAIMCHLDQSTSPKDAASLIILAQHRDILRETMSRPDVSALAICSNFQRMMLAGLQVTLELSYPAPLTYPTTFDHVDSFRNEVRVIAAFMTNYVSAATRYGQPH